jgi:peptidoglycan/LPS O-acetylase OafA/YrhL
MHGRDLRAITRIDYRPDIDGLRAISILLVVAFHAFPDYVTGGFVGVDAFFVISGFLITKIILSECASGKFSLRAFYARRILRIFPALICVLTITYVVGWLILLPDDLSVLGKNIAGGAAFVFNLLQMRTAGYFATDATLNPVLHLWSLGIEEQFYIFWPLLIMALAGGRWLRMATLGIAGVSFIINLILTAQSHELAFYSPLTRAWELLAGGMLADRYIRTGSGGFDDIKALVGISLLIGAAVLLNSATLFPGWRAAFPVVGTVLLIDAEQSFLNRRLLTTKSMVWLGLISYPLYLWHWPLLSYLAILRNGTPNLLENWVAVVVAVFLAWATFRFIEFPIRRIKRPVRWLALGMTAIGTVGVFTMLAAGFPFRFPEEIREIAALSSKGNTGFRYPCFLEAGTPSELSDTCIESGPGPVIFLWGDSTAAALYPGLAEVVKNGNRRVAQFTAAGCAPVLELNLHCDDFNKAVISFIGASRPDIVLMHAMWERGDISEKLHSTIKILRNIGVPRIVVIGPVPVWKRTLPNALINYYRLNHIIADRLTGGVSGQANDEWMESIAKNEGVEYISAWRSLCNSDGCITTTGKSAKDVVTFDTVHLTNSGSAFLMKSLSDSLMR